MKHSTHSHTAPAVVIDMDCFTGVQSIRILAKRGIPVIGIGKSPDHYCSKTNFCKQKIYVDTKSEALIDKLAELGPTLPEKAVLFPCADTSVLLISAHRARLTKWYHIALPEHEIVAMLMDKMSFIAFAQKQQLAIPQVYFLRNRAQAEEAATKMSYPCILKPTLKTKLWEVSAKQKAFKINDAAELLRVYDEHAPLTEVLMVQRFVHGSDANHYTCNCYFDRQSQTLVSFVSRKLRQWPLATGTACLSQEWRNSEVEQTTIDLFRRVGYIGLGYVEMKQDIKDGKYYIIEPNIGRPTGRSALAEASGVELLYTMYCELTGHALPENRLQMYTDTKWIYLRRDLQSAIKYWRRGELSLRQWRESVRGKKVEALFDWRDPLPFLCDWLRVIKQAITGKGKSGDAPVQRSMPPADKARPLNGVTASKNLEKTPGNYSAFCHSVRNLF